MKLEIWSLPSRKVIRDENHEPIKEINVEGKCVLAIDSCAQLRNGDSAVIIDGMGRQVIVDSSFHAPTNTWKAYIDPDRDNKYGDCLKASQFDEFEVESIYLPKRTLSALAVKAGDIIPEAAWVVNPTNSREIKLLSSREVIERDGKLFLKKCEKFGGD